MDLFEHMREKSLKKQAPLAARMRPTKLDDIVGQQHILQPGKLLYRAIEADRLGSLIFYGPPGTGKTTTAKVIANTSQSVFRQLNATVAGKKDIIEVINLAKETLALSEKRVLLFIDEIHRFNKLQQDALLPYVEDGTITLIGATTENPYFEVNKALVSRSRIFELEILQAADIRKLLERALTKDCILQTMSIKVTEEAMAFLAEMANGDARTALNALELAVVTTVADSKGQVMIDLSVAEECIQRRSLNYGKHGDDHYDIISAFIKSIRGSDPDASIYYLARMLYAGEDPKFIARRMIISASEDIGNADPRALQMAISAAQAVDYVGLPEAQLVLSQVVAYLATAPKSNASTKAVFKANEAVREVTIKGLPLALRDAHYKGSKKLGRGEGYRYPHDYPHHYVEQHYLPDELKAEQYYQPTNQGYERRISEWMKFLKENK